MGITGPNVEDLRSFHRHFSSNESNPSLIDDEGRRSPSIRPRSRSLRSHDLFGCQEIQKP